MSLIKCPECHKDISPKATSCPNCGVAISGNLKRCPICGTYTLMDAQACPECGAKFVMHSKDVTPQQTTEAPTTETRDTVADETSWDETSKDVEFQTEDDAPAATDENGDEAKTPTDGEQESDVKKNNSSPWWLLILCILAIGIGGFFYWEHINQEASEEEAFLLLQDCNDPLNYEDFIARFPKSEHIGEVRAKLQDLLKIDEMWEKVRHSQDVEELEDFIRQHPNSPNKKVALHRIDSLDWRNADRKGSSAAYDAYILKHDDGEYITQAYTSRDAARRREEQARRDSIAAAAEQIADSARVIVEQSLKSED